ncbi:MAG: reprolysin-like metallopeptidase [Saprospiraceae bacterium]
MLKHLISLSFLLLACHIQAQDFWKDASASMRSMPGERRIVPQNFRSVELDVAGLSSWLNQAPERFTKAAHKMPVLVLPMPDGSKQRFQLVESPVMAPELQSRYPESRCFTGYGLDESGTLLKCDLTPWGFHAMILRQQAETVFIDPYIHGNTAFYTVYYKKDYASDPDALATCVTENNAKELTVDNAQASQGDCQLRRYRLALACTGEYAFFHGNTKPLVIAAFNTTMNRINGIYERELDVTMQLVAKNDTLIFLDAATDPYTNNSGSTMLGQNVTTCNTRIGAANFDVGHVFSTSGGGIASVGVICDNSNKARGVTGRSAPIGDPFDVDYVAHEMGHQFGGEHTQNNDCNRVAGSSMEPGSASTIMGYAGICSPNVQSNSDDYFHAISLQQITAVTVTGNGNTCPVKINTGNTAPTVNDVTNFTIPRATPFALTAVGTDANGDALTYCWEQMDAQFATMPPVSTSTTGPLFRSFDPSSSPTRYFPRLTDLVNNVNPTWEELPTVARSMNFRVTVRDNHPGGGCTAEDNVVVTVSGTAGPFVVTQPNAASITWTSGTSQQITWDVANTNTPPINTANVRLTLSTDGGLTYPTILSASSPNNGSAQVTVPNVSSTQCRIRVEGRNNIFFDISDNNFTISAPQIPSYSLNLSVDTATVCADDTLLVNIAATPLLGFNNTIALSITGLPPGASATFNPAVIAADGSSVLRISGFSPAAAGNYVAVVTALGDTIQQTYDIELNVVPGAPTGLSSLIAPSDGANMETLLPVLQWGAVNFAKTYRVQVSTNPSFDQSALVFDNEVAAIGVQVPGPGLLNGIVYYWRVQAVNSCGEGSWSPFQAFQVGNSNCDQVFSAGNLPIVISSSNTSTISSTVNVPVNALIENIKVSVDITHTWVGDLSASVVSPGGDTVLLFDRPDVPFSDFGCSGDNLDLIFDDMAVLTANDLETTCELNPAIAGSFKPIESLSAFTGEPAQGAWKLLISDFFEQDGGALTAWSLDFCFPQMTDTAVLLTNDTLYVGLGLSGVVSTNELVMQLNGTAAQGVFTLLELPLHGVIRLNAAPLSIGGTFTQADINNGVVTYLHNGNAQTVDAFRFDVFDDATNGWLHNQTFNIRIVQNTLTASAAVSQAVKCVGSADGAITATAAGLPGPYTYSLNGGASQSSDTFTGLPAGSYTVVITGAFGFTATSNTVVLSNPTPLTLDATVVDDDITAVGAGGTGALEYSLNGTTFQSSNQFIDQPNGIYTVTVRDANGCTATDQAIVAVNTLLVAAVQTADIKCNGDATAAITVTAGGGTMPYTYTYDGVTFGANSVITNLPAGSYTITVTDNVGFTAVTNTVVIGQPTAISLAANAVNNAINATASGGTGAIQYSIDGVAYQSGNVFTNVVNNTYTVYARDANGCTETTTVLVNVPPPTASVDAVTNATCFGDDNGAIQLCIDGFWPPFMVGINTPGANIQAVAGACTSNLAIGNLGGGSYTITITDAQGLSTILAGVVTEPAQLVLNVTTNGDTIIASGSGGASGLEYSVDSLNWQSNPVFPDLPNGIYTVYVRDANGCIATKTGVVVTSSTIDVVQSWGFQVSPNPGNGLFQLLLRNAPENLRIDAFDATGRLLLQQRFQNPAGEWNTTLDLTTQPAGLYWLRLSTQGQSGAVKVIIN